MTYGDPEQAFQEYPRRFIVHKMMREKPNRLTALKSPTKL